MALYADVNGKQFPVTRGQDVGRYQVRINMIPASQYHFAKYLNSIFMELVKIKFCLGFIIKNINRRNCHIQNLVHSLGLKYETSYNLKGL